MTGRPTSAWAAAGFLLALLAASGCRTTPESAAAPATSASVDSGDLEAQFERGKDLLATGYNMEAVKQFAYLRDHAPSPEDRDRAAVGLSMALSDSGNTGAALGALQPLPVLPRPGVEARKCVLAGELYLQQKNFEQARLWLARGLEVEADSHRPYRAAGFFNLGKTLLGLDELTEASAAFAAAQESFLANGDHDSAGECERIIADIERSLL